MSSKTNVHNFLPDLANNQSTFFNSYDFTELEKNELGFFILKVKNRNFKVWRFDSTSTPNRLKKSLRACYVMNVDPFLDP